MGHIYVMDLVPQIISYKKSIEKYDKGIKECEFLKGIFEENLINLIGKYAY